MNVFALTRSACCAGALVTSVCGLLSGCGGGHSASSSSGVPATSANAAVAEDGPLLGYVWSGSDQSLRPVMGVPGASQFGPSVIAPGTYLAAAASAQSGVAVLVDRSGDVSLMGLPAGSPQPLAGVHVSGNAQIVFSPSGGAAVVFVAGQSAAYFLTGLSASTQAQVQVLSSPFAPVAMAVSDTGQVVAATGASPTTLTLLTGNDARVATLGGFGGVAFLPGGSNLLAVDSVNSTLTLISSSAAPQNIASNAFRSPFAVAASQDGRTAVVANAGDASVVRIDLTNAANQMRIPCACQPDRLSALSGNAVFALTGPGSVPTWMVDASASQPQTLFIPAIVKQ